jgi:octaprenyl-diphosphate synthase
MRGGKRWRPLVCYIIYSALSDTLCDDILPLLPLIECSHNASLIHDDLEDSSPLRRGKKAIHLIYGCDTAINAGSFLYFLAADSIENYCINSNADEIKKNKLYAMWIRYMKTLHTGQSRDIYWHSTFDYIPTVPEYLKMCAQKTGCLARFACDAALLAADAAKLPKAVQLPGAAQLLNAVENLGVGFQIIDDVKNITLNGNDFGKKIGDDIIENKKSLPIILYLQNANEQKVAFVKNCFAAAARQGPLSTAISDLINELQADGAIQKAETTGRELINNANMELNKFAQSRAENSRALFSRLSAYMGL